MAHAPPAVYRKALQRALALAGGQEMLCRRLGVSQASLRAWLDGRADLPTDIFLQVVDIVSTPATPARLEQGPPPLDEARDRRLYAAVHTALAATGAERGNVQLVEPQGLRIVAQIGFAPPFLDFFACVADTRSACGAALANGGRVVVENVERDPLFAGASRAIMLDAGARAVQSTPLIACSGAVLGMLSTHYERPYRPREEELEAIDRIAADTARWLESEIVPASIE